MPKTSPHSTVNFKNAAVSTLISISTVATLAIYLSARRGYFNLSIFNKSLASGSLVILGIVLLIGPLCRLYDFLDRCLTLRKSLGIAAFILALIHVYIILFPLAHPSPPLATYSGLIALLIFIFLFIISFEKLKVKLTIPTWWKLQYTGARLAFIFILIHMTILKNQGWTKWLAHPSPKLAIPSFPPASLLVAIFSFFVILTRLTELGPRKAARFLIPAWLLNLFAYSVYLFLR